MAIYWLNSSGTSEAPYSTKETGANTIDQIRTNTSITSADTVMVARGSSINETVFSNKHTIVFNIEAEDDGVNLEATRPEIFYNVASNGPFFYISSEAVKISGIKYKSINAAAPDFGTTFSGGGTSAITIIDESLCTDYYLMPGEGFWPSAFSFPFVMPQDGEVESITVKTSATAGAITKLGIAIYDNTAGAWEKIADGYIDTLATGGIEDVTINLTSNAVLTSGVTYTLWYNRASDNQTSLFVFTDSGLTYYSATDIYRNWPATITTYSTSLNYKIASKLNIVAAEDTGYITFENCIIEKTANNDTIFDTGVPGLLYNCLIINSYNGVASNPIWSYSSLDIQRCTIIDMNTTTVGMPVVATSKSSAIFTDNIIYTESNRAIEYPVIISGSISEVSNNIWWAPNSSGTNLSNLAYHNDTSSIVAGTNNTNIDPDFAETTYYSISSASPAKGSGSSGMNIGWSPMLLIIDYNVDRLNREDINPYPETPINKQGADTDFERGFLTDNTFFPDITYSEQTMMSDLVIKRNLIICGFNPKFPLPTECQTDYKTTLY